MTERVLFKMDQHINWQKIWKVREIKAGLRTHSAFYRDWFYEIATGCNVSSLFMLGLCVILSWENILKKYI